MRASSLNPATRGKIFKEAYGYAPTLVIPTSDELGGRQLPNIFSRAVEGHNFVDIEADEGIRSNFWVMRGDVLFAPPKELI